MIEFLIGFIVTVISLLIGFKLGSRTPFVSDKVKERIKEILERKAPKSDIGMVQRPDAHQIETFNNPKLAEEEKAMSDTFSQIIPKQ